MSDPTYAQRLGWHGNVGNPYDDATARAFEDRWRSLRPGEGEGRPLDATPRELNRTMAALRRVADNGTGSVDARIAYRLVDRTPAQWTPLMLREARRIVRHARG